MKLGEIYEREDGELFEVVALCHEPTVTLQGVVSNERVHGGVSGLMWHRYKRVGQRPTRAAFENERQG